MSSKTLKLPKGSPTIFDEVMIDYLCKDVVFKESVEESLGPIKRLWADWASGSLVYELLDGDVKYTDLKFLIKQLNDMDYMKEYQN